MGQAGEVLLPAQSYGWHQPSHLEWDVALT